MREIDLDVRQVYVTPTGRLCRLMSRAEESVAKYHSFRYIDRACGVHDGFTLSPRNVHILKLRSTQ